MRNLLQIMGNEGRVQKHFYTETGGYSSLAETTNGPSPQMQAAAQSAGGAGAAPLSPDQIAAQKADPRWFSPEQAQAQANLQALQAGKTVTVNGKVFNPQSTAQATATATPAVPAQPAFNPEDLAKTMYSGNYTGPSIVDYLKSVGEDSSLTARAGMAVEAGLVKTPAEYLDLAKKGANADINTQLLNKYRGIHEGMKGTAPSDNAQGRLATDQAASKQPQPQAPQGLSPQDATQQFPMSNNLGLGIPDAPIAVQQQQDQMAKFFQEAFQKLNESKPEDSMLNMYQKFNDLEGLSGDKAKLRDLAQRIDGTEVDVRTEIQHAGGFATESQVQAIKDSRTKDWVKQANNLQSLIQDKEKMVSNMMQYAGMDRDRADRQFEQKFNIAEKYYAHKDKMVADQKSQVADLVQNIGYNGVASQMTPYNRRVTEGIMGWPQGFLDHPPETLAQQKETLANRRADISEANANRRFDIQEKNNMIREQMANQRLMMQESNAERRFKMQMQTANRQDKRLQIQTDLALSREAKMAVPDYFTDPSISAFKGIAAPMGRLRNDITQMKQNGMSAGISQSILDAMTQIDRGGGQITEANVGLLTGGQTLSDYATSLQSRLVGTGGIIDENVANQLSDLAQGVFNEYQKVYQDRIGVYNNILEQKRPPSVSPEEWARHSPISDITDSLQSPPMPDGSPIPIINPDNSVTFTN